MSGLTQLQGFPMLMAVSEGAVNRRLRSIYKSGKSPFPSYWQLKNDAKTLQLIVEEFGAPQIDFNSTRQGCLLTIPVEKGHILATGIQMADGPQINKQNIDIGGLDIIVETQVNQIKHTQLCTNQFDVQSLYVDLENISQVAFSFSQEVDAAVTTAVQQNLATVVQDKLKEIAQQDKSALVFGHVDIPKDPACKQAIGSLAPTSMTYSIHRQTDQYGNYLGGSINYLLWPDPNTPMPSGGAAGQFSQSWVDSGQEATFVISDYLLIKSFVIPALQVNYPNMPFNITAGNSEAGIPARASLTANFPFSQSGLNNPFYRKFDIYVLNGTIVFDYEFSFRKKVMALWEKYEAQGASFATVSMENGAIKTNITTHKPNVRRIKGSFWHEFAQGLGIGFSLGLATLAYNHDTKEGINLGEAFKLNFDTNVMPVPRLVQLPGRGVFNYKNVLLDKQLKIDCEYSSTAAKTSC